MIVSCCSLEFKNKISSDVKESDIEGMLYCKHIILSIYHNKTTFYFLSSFSILVIHLIGHPILQMLNVV